MKKKNGGISRPNVTYSCLFQQERELHIYIYIYIYTMIHSLLYTMIPFSSSEKIIDLKKTILTLPEQNATEQNQRTFERGVFLG